MPTKLTLSNLLVGGGGLIAFVFSFLAFFKSGGESVNAWDGDAYAFATTLPAVIALVAAVWVGLELAGVKLPGQVLTFTGPQLKATWGIAAFGIMLSWFSVDMYGIDKGAGYWLMFIGTLAMAVGAVLALVGIGTEPLAKPASAQPSTDAPVPPPPPADGEPLPPPPPGDDPA